MQKFKFIAGLFVIVAITACANPAADKPQAEVGEARPATDALAGSISFAIGEGSSVEWTGSKVTGSHAGGFKTLAGTIEVADGDPTKSSVKISIDTTSIWSDSDRLTGHLKSADFFDVEAHPMSTFETTSIVRDGADFSVTGNLDLHGVTKSITFPATIEVGPEQVMARAEFAIKRFDFNIEYKGKADDLDPRAAGFRGTHREARRAHAPTACKPTEIPRHSRAGRQSS
jgi:polyisoprenoid-binding protein YceI